MEGEGGGLLEQRAVALARELSKVERLEAEITALADDYLFEREQARIQPQMH